MPDSILPEAEKEPLRISPTYPLSLEVREQVPVQVETSRSIERNAEIMEMLKTMKKEMEESELKWNNNKGLEKNSWRLQPEGRNKYGKKIRE